MIENIDWQITSKCNRKCNYCFGPIEETVFSRTDAKKCVDIFQSIGVKQIGISGGEPLLCSYFEDLAKYINSKNISLYLSTNCDLYYKYSDVIKNNVNIIGIPIDGSNNSIHDKHRGEGSFDICLKTIEDIMASDSSIKIKIGTVLTKYNVDDLERIASLIAPYEEKILYWKIYELIGYDRNCTNVYGLKPVSKININNLSKHFNPSKIVNDNIEKRTRSYFFIKPNGDVFIPILKTDLSEELVVGNIIRDEIDEIISRFNNEVLWDGYNKKYRYMKVY